MSLNTYHRLEEVIQDDLFPEADLALRAGRHIDQDDLDTYAFLLDALPWLEPFYRRYGFDLVRSSDGYFFLIPDHDKLPRRTLSAADMLVGQALALMLLDPMSVQAAGVIPRAQLLELLDKLLGTDNLIFAVNPRRRRRDEKVDHEIVRKEIDRALRNLHHLGFIDLSEDGQLRLRTPLLRFADPVRDLGSPAEALARLINRSQATLLDLDAEDTPDAPHAAAAHTADEEDDQP